ncbi:hypothetical protein [Roseovarius sp. Pro17]|uniref:VOC family protein n=1 Tax=Roseovarius sp. Pro17 TaxID=3108175 RepID=UPI002D774136|nr:hypothetical protein [Roseovarius sp. Pro17]
MKIEKIYAQIVCSEHVASTGWYRSLFARDSDATPMAGLAEWHHGESVGLQLFEDASKAGQQTLTLMVGGLYGEKARLEDAGLYPREIEPADTASLVRLSDPDGNVVVLAQSTHLLATRKRKDESWTR